MATWIVGGVLLVIVGAIIWKMVKDKKSGNSACSCGGDCGSCGTNGGDNVVDADYEVVDDDNK